MFSYYGHNFPHFRVSYGEEVMDYNSQREGFQVSNVYNIYFVLEIQKKLGFYDMSTPCVVSQSKGQKR